MKSYSYIARDSSGVRKEGFKQAACSNDVLGWLREQGATPVLVDEVSVSVKKTRLKPQRKRIKSDDLAALCWQLSTMVEGGIPITTAIETISGDIENLRLREVSQQIVEKLRKGETFSGSLSQFPKIFNHLFCAMILAGETGGNLSVVLRELAEHFDNRDKLARKVKGAIAYPAFVFVFIVLIVIFIMAFIIPRFRSIFDQFGGELPAFTRAFMGVYDMIRYNLVYIIGSLLSMVILGVLVSKTKKGHYLFCKIVLALPLLGKILREAFVAMFCQTMATLLNAGVSVLEILDILLAMTKNDIIKDSIIQAREQIVEGSDLSSSFSISGFFPNMVVKMIRVGEESGSLSRVLDTTSRYYERKVDALISTVLSLLEPIMIIVVGGVVLTVVLALYLPIFSMSEVAR